MTINNELVSLTIAGLKSINVDGETMEHIVESVGLSEQLLRQLVLKADANVLNGLIEERKELKISTCNTCSSCMYWSRFTTTNAVQLNSGECNFIGYVADREIVPSDSIGLHVSADDDSGLHVTTQTGENFGCVKHSPK